MAQAVITKSQGHDAWIEQHQNNITYSQDMIPEKGTPYTFVVYTVLDKSAAIYVVPSDFDYKITFDLTETLPNGQVVNKYVYSTPPLAMGLTYHDLGDKDEFCGLWIRSCHYRKDMTQYYIDSEIRLPVDVANIVIDYLAGEKPAKLSRDFKYLISTSPSLLPVEIATAGSSYGNGNRIR
ncbi:MAG: hypothetical protein U0M50_07950 [Paramuribaculum sp.]